MSWFKKTISRATGNFVKVLGDGLGDTAGRMLEVVPGGHKVRSEYKSSLDKLGNKIKKIDLPSLSPKFPETPAAEMPSIEMPDYSEYMEMMKEYMGAMAEAMNREEPAVEPLKQAQTAIGEAKDDTARKQLLRRGLMSTYTRYGSQGGTQRLGA